MVNDQKTNIYSPYEYIIYHNRIACYFMQWNIYIIVFLNQYLFARCSFAMYTRLPSTNPALHIVLRRYVCMSVTLRNANFLCTAVRTAHAHVHNLL